MDAAIFEKVLSIPKLNLVLLFYLETIRRFLEINKSLFLEMNYNIK